MQRRGEPPDPRTPSGPLVVGVRGADSAPGLQTLTLLPAPRSPAPPGAHRALPALGPAAPAAPPPLPLARPQETTPSERALQLETTSGAFLTASALPAQRAALSSAAVCTRAATSPETGAPPRPSRPELLLPPHPPPRLGPGFLELRASPLTCQGPTRAGAQAPPCPARPSPRVCCSAFSSKRGQHLHPGCALGKIVATAFLSGGVSPFSVGPKSDSLPPSPAPFPLPPFLSAPPY